MNRYRRIGVSSLEVHPVALGAAAFGWTVPGGRAVEQLDRYVELGGNFVDTADSYSSGRSEQIIGTWMRERGNRDSVVVATKVGKSSSNPGLSARAIRAAVDSSLERLQTDRIDLLYFHGEDAETPLAESLSAVGALIDDGKVGVLGASNFSTDSLLHARVLSSDGLPRFEAVTLELSLMRRDVVDEGMRMALEAQRISLMPYFVLANGFLGRHRDLKPMKYEDTHRRRAVSHAGRLGNQVNRALDDVALSHGVDAATISVAWSLMQSSVASAVLGADTVSDVDALMYGAEVHLTAAQLTELNRASIR